MAEICESRDILQVVTPESIQLAKVAMMDLRQGRRTDVRCPRCGGEPAYISSDDGGGAIVRCECKYICNMEIYL